MIDATYNLTIEIEADIPGQVSEPEMQLLQRHLGDLLAEAILIETECEE